MADERRAARIAVLVGAGHVEVGGPWPHSPLADERLPLGSQSLLVVAALRSAGGLLRRGSGQLKVGLLVLAGGRPPHSHWGGDSMIGPWGSGSRQTLHQNR